MKITSSDLLAILRQFRQATDDNVPRHIDQIASSYPQPINQLVRFRFDRRQYFLLIDDTAEDHASYIMQQIYTAKSDATGEILPNPLSDIATYGLPFKGKDVYLFQQQRTTQRLDSLLATRHPETSRSTWQKHIKAGHVAVNDRVVCQPRQLVAETDSIAINLPDATDHSDKTLPILYIDDDVIVINKPAGILTHSKGALNDEFTVADFFRRYTSVGLETNRPGIVHRLDRDTSGVMIGARTPEAFQRLKKQFAERHAKKTYLAVVAGKPRQQQAKIDVPLGRNPAAPSTFRADPRGKSAQTIYKVLASQSSMSLLALRPRTGRTHQLRVHLAYIGTPIVGDRIYGSAGERLLQHAYQLEITTRAGLRQTFVAPPPAAFMALFPEGADVIARL